MSSKVIPHNLNEVFKNLNGYRKSLIRWYSDRSGSINSQDTLRWTFPKEIITMETLMHQFEFTSTAAGTSSAAVTRTGTFFPRNSASIIDTITVFINGAVYENIQSYNHLYNIIYDNTAGLNFYTSGIRALECTDPSIRYTVTNSSDAISCAVQGSLNASSDNTDAKVCDTKRTLQVRNWIGFLGTCNEVLDLTDVELVVEIRYASPNIVFKGIEAAATLTAASPTYTINNYFMTAQKITFDDDYYGSALKALKASGNYSIVYKTYSSARSAAATKSSNPSLTFSTTAKYLSRLFLTVLDKDYDTVAYLQNQGTNSTTASPSMSAILADVKTNITAFNQSIYFKKNAVALTEASVFINGLPVYPFPQSLALIKNNNMDAFGLEKDNTVGDYPGMQSLEQWSKFCFVQGVSFEHPGAFKNKIVSGYPNPSGNLLTISWNTTFDSTNTNNCILLGYAERVVRANFKDKAVTIEY
jgi:hypothetical protein